MIAVIFEVYTNDEGKEEYLAIAAALREHLIDMPGFISIERFQSLSDPQKMLSLSFWEDEQAVARWRNVETHRAAQIKGKDDLFKDYRIRVASVSRDYSLTDRGQAPEFNR